MNFIIYVFFACVVVVASIPLESDYELIPCPNCGREPCTKPFVKCYFGTFENRCGKIDCRKGPGELCDDDRYLLGFCAKGLYCKCNECNGCWLPSQKCHHNDNCIADHTFKRAGLEMY